MIRFFRAIAVVAACGLLVIGSGCAQSNEDQADITGIAPEGAPMTQEDMGAAMRGGQGAAADYPGASQYGQ